MREAERILSRIVAAYLQGRLSQSRAAKLIGIRKEEFAEYADGEMLLAAIERAAWGYYLSHFAYVFPECDPRAVRSDSLPVRLGDDLMHDGLLSWYPEAPVKLYDASEAAQLPPSQPHLDSLIGQTGTASDPMTVKCRYGNRRPPAVAIAACRNRLPQFDEREATSNGPEFEFTEAA